MSKMVKQWTERTVSEHILCCVADLYNIKDNAAVYTVGISLTDCKSIICCFSPLTFLNSRVTPLFP